MLQEDYVGLQKYCICAEADYLSQRVMKCETDDATYSLQSLQMTIEIKVSVTGNIKTQHFPVTRGSMLVLSSSSIPKVCNLPCKSQENMRSR